MQTKEFVIPKVNPESAIIRAVDCIERLPPDKAWLVSIKSYKSSRSREQNNTYWMWLTEIGDHLGYTPDELHEFCRNEYLPRAIITIKTKINTKVREVPMSTTKLSIEEMAQYMERIQQLAAEHGITLTQPEAI